MGQDSKTTKRYRRKVVNLETERRKLEHYNKMLELRVKFLQDEIDKLKPKDVVADGTITTG